MTFYTKKRKYHLLIVYHLILPVHGVVCVIGVFSSMITLGGAFHHVMGLCLRTIATLLIGVGWPAAQCKTTPFLLWMLILCAIVMS